MVVLDVRTSTEISKYRLRSENQNSVVINQVHIDLRHFGDQEYVDDVLQDHGVSKNQTAIYCLCAAGVRSAVAAHYLQSKGYSFLDISRYNAINIEGGVYRIQAILEKMSENRKENENSNAGGSNG